VVEVSFAQEAELDLFTEQCFGPAFGQVLTTAVDLLLAEGYPPEAVLLELYMSGEFAFTLGKIAELGMVEQAKLHSRTSQYGSMSRGMRFILPELRKRMEQGLEEIRSGQFAQEWTEEQNAGCPTLEALQAAARALPLHQLELELREALGELPSSRLPAGHILPQSGQAVRQEGSLSGYQGWAAIEWLRSARRRWLGWIARRDEELNREEPLTPEQMELVLQEFIVDAIADNAVQAFSRGHSFMTHYVLTDTALEFSLCFHDGEVKGGLGPPDGDAEVRLETAASTLDGIFSGRTNAMRAAMTGGLTFHGNARLAMTIQQIQDDLVRVYKGARRSVLA
jgi:putative sterol carrier protein